MMINRIFPCIMLSLKSKPLLCTIDNFFINYIKMNKLLYIMCVITLFSCSQKTGSGTFNVSGELKNAPDQKIYLEQISFNQQPPHVIDTADVVNGKFDVKANAAEEGLYRLRFEKSPAYIFINDDDNLKFSAIAGDSILQIGTFNSPLNCSSVKFIRFNLFR